MKSRWLIFEWTVQTRFKLWEFFGAIILTSCLSIRSNQMTTRCVLYCSFLLVIDGCEVLKMKKVKNKNESDVNWICSFNRTTAHIYVTHQVGQIFEQVPFLFQAKTWQYTVKVRSVWRGAHYVGKLRSHWSHSID